MATIHRHKLSCHVALEEGLGSLGHGFEGGCLCFRGMCFGGGRVALHCFLACQDLERPKRLGPGMLCPRCLGESCGMSAMMNTGPWGSARWPHGLLPVSSEPRG